MLWYTRKEIAGLMRASYYPRTISGYAAELADGWRIWIMIDMAGLVVLALLVVGPLSMPQGIIAGMFLVVPPIFLTIGYIIGAWSRRYPVWNVLARAVRLLRRL